MVSKYGDIIFSDGTIQREQTWTFNNIDELLDYREQLLLTDAQKMTCHLDTLKIEITEYVQFERDMIGREFVYPDNLEVIQ
tara:strand:- start:2460 stop:2702 length:243 start_codon:yes stop_codon:yes gene_type:complete